MTRRPMTDTLAAALDSLTTNERRAILMQTAPLTGDIAFERLLRGVAAEIRVLNEQDAATLAALEAATRDIG